MSPWLITGANGFLGRHVLDRVRSRDDLFLIGRRAPEGWPSDRFDQVDLRYAESVKTAIHKVRPAVVLHLAGLTPPASSEELYQTNVLGTLHLLDALRALEKPVRVLLAGSAAELGPVTDEDLPVSENYPARPVGAYGLSKHLASVTALASQTPIEPVVTRIFNPIGPGTPKAQALGRFAFELSRKNPDPLVLQVGDIDTKRDFIDVRDVADAVIQLAESARPGLYHIGTGSSRSVREGLELLIKQSGRTVELHVEAILRSTPGPRDSRADIAKLQAEIGWVPQYTFEQSIADLWASVHLES